MNGGRSLLAVGCMLAALAGGCGGSSGDSTAPDRATTAAAAPATTAQTSTPPSEEAKPAARYGVNERVAPNPYREPAGAPPHPGARVDRVITHDVKVGRGPAVRPGDSVNADYIEAQYATGLKFLRAWKNHRPFGTENMVLTTPMWMRGLVVGMTGMRPGGRRIIIVPARLSDVHDADRTYSYRKVIYWDVVLRSISLPREG